MLGYCFKIKISRAQFDEIKNYIHFVSYIDYTFTSSLAIHFNNWIIAHMHVKSHDFCHTQMYM